ncbi:MAG: hypothetical protein IPG63_12380 [Xanthomonadales bacterium]|nr:hypothetical protein [Xanthomonadales bacterium]MCC6561838.1 hypothetical protein [Xanthomonadales bacterium]
MSRSHSLFLVSCMALAKASTAAAGTDPGISLKPKVLRQMMQATTEPKATIDARTPMAAGMEGAIPFPAAIAFAADGCFAGYFSQERLEELQFECIQGTDTLDLRKIDAATFAQAKGRRVVLELIPSFAKPCAPCAAAPEALRSLLRKRKLDVKIALADIGY